MKRQYFAAYFAFALLTALTLAMAGCPRPKPEAASNGSAAIRNGEPQAVLFRLEQAISGEGTPTGEFEQLSAVCATDSNVYIADRAYSSVYIYSREGNYVRSIGCGFNVSEYELDDDEMLDSFYEVNDSLPEELANQIALNRFFKPEDLDIAAGHLFVLSSYISSLASSPKLDPGIFEFGLQGQFVKIHKLLSLTLPAYFAVDKALFIAGTDPNKNDYQILGDENSIHYSNRKLSANVRDYLSDTIRSKNNPTELSAKKLRMSNTGIGRDQFRQISGVAAYTPEKDGELQPESTKFIICDRGNSRLKIVNRTGLIQKILTGTDSGHTAFEAPIDVAVDATGNIYILDAGGYVAVLDSTFNFKGTFGIGEMESPRAIFVDSIGDVWIADPGRAEVLHYKASV